MTPEELEWQQAAGAGRRKALGANARVAFAILVAGVTAILGAAPGVALASWSRSGDIARYEEFQARGGFYYGTAHEMRNPSGYGAEFVVFPLISGGLIGGLSLAVAMMLVAKDRTYARGLFSATP